MNPLDIEANIVAGSCWRHRNGNEYRILMVANLPGDERYPKTVVYTNVRNGTLWARRFDDWLRSFTLVHAASYPPAQGRT